MKRDYSFAQRLFGFLSFIGWTLIVVGVIYSIVGASAGGTIGGYAGKGGGALLGFLIGMSAGLGLVTIGMLVLAVVQIGRAGIDTAENTQDLLGVARDQLAVLRTGQAQRAPGAAAPSFASRPAEVPRSDVERAPAASGAPTPAPPEPLPDLEPGAPSAQHRMQRNSSFGPIRPASLPYRGETITVSADGAFVGGKRYADVEAAKESVNAVLRIEGERRS